jgi:predicted nucleic acid-binding protein
MRAGDTIVAATAIEFGMTLVSANAKHFRPIKKLTFKVFKP